MADRLARRTSFSKAVVREAVDGVFAAIDDAVANGEEVADRGIRGLLDEWQAGSYRTQREDRRADFHIVVDFAEIQDREYAEGCRKCGSPVMTPKRHPIATGSASSSLTMVPARLLYDDGHSASCRDGGGQTQGSRGVDGCTAAGVDAASRMRRGDGEPLRLGRDKGSF